MKIRVKGDSIRFRLTKKEVETLVKSGEIIDQTQFTPNQHFVYSLKKTDSDSFEANLSNNCITIHIPENKLSNWDTNDIVGFNHTLDNGSSEGLYLLIEKDFKCLTPRERENEDDNYANPLSEHTC